MTAVQTSSPTTGSTVFDIAVIGAGVIGIATAYRLAEAGQRVLLIDQDAPGRGTSYGNAGHIGTEQIEPLASPDTLKNLIKYLNAPHPAVSFRWDYALSALPWMIRFGLSCRPGQYRKGLKALSALQAHSLSSWQALLSDIGATDLLIHQGSYGVCETPEGAQSGQALQAQLAALGIACEWLKADDMQACLPQARFAITGGIRYTQSGHVTNPYSVSLALISAFHALGGHYQKAKIHAIHPGVDNLTVQGEGQRFHADKVLISAGAWSHHLARPLGLNLPLETERGYHLHWSNVTTAYDRSIAFMERRIMMTPMGPDLRLTGGTELGGLKAPPTTRHLDSLNHHAGEILPDHPVEAAQSWIGYRPSLPDFLPAMGRLKSDPRLFISTGHQHLGLTLGAISAQLMRDLILDRPTRLDMSPYTPHRFHTL